MAFESGANDLALDRSGPLLLAHLFHCDVVSELASECGSPKTLLAEDTTKSIIEIDLLPELASWGVRHDWLVDCLKVLPL